MVSGLGSHRERQGCERWETLSALHTRNRGADWVLPSCLGLHRWRDLCHQVLSCVGNVGDFSLRAASPCALWVASVVQSSGLS